MRANELMLGDFVFHEKYGNAIIETIDNDFGDNPSVKLISENIKHKEGYKYGYCWCDLDEIFPIPLTPEILEKSGLEHNKGEMYYHGKLMYHHESKYVSICYGANNYWHLHINNGCDFSKAIKYVHELQHALKLCGIGIEITL